MRTQLAETVKDRIGSVQPFAETYDFQCDEVADAELTTLPQKKLVERLLIARNVGNGPVRETDRGYWGDMAFLAAQPINPGSGATWTRLGSPEWLDEILPSWNGAEHGAELDEGDR